MLNALSGLQCAQRIDVIKHRPSRTLSCLTHGSHDSKLKNNKAIQATPCCGPDYADSCHGMRHVQPLRNNYCIYERQGAADKLNPRERRQIVVRASP